MTPIARYAIITLTPALLILLGAGFGGYFLVAALLWLTLLGAGLDAVLPQPAPGGDATWATRLSVALAVLHLLMIPVALFGLSNPNLSAGAQVMLFFATASFMGQVSHPNAHELIHSPNARLRALGAMVYTSLLYGHHVSAHRYIHHIHVGTREDPATPLPGEGFWSYTARAWPGNIRAGFEAEVARLDHRDAPSWSPNNPYYLWGLGALGMAIAVTATGGLLALVVFLALAGLVHLQILMSDYIQHYGLQRLRLPDGDLEPIGPHHSWNAPNGFTALLMLNAPRHSEHHMTATRPFQELSQDDGPRLPHAMPIMAMIALFPGLWRDMMDRRALKVMEAAQARIEPHADTQDTSPLDLRRALRG